MSLDPAMETSDLSSDHAEPPSDTVHETAGIPTASSDMPREFTPKKPVRTYQKREKRQRRPDSKRREANVHRDKSEDNDDQSSGDVAAEAAEDDPVPAKQPYRSTRRQPPKPTTQVTKTATRTSKRKPESSKTKPKPNASSPANGSDGSDLTDIEEGNGAEGEPTVDTVESSLARAKIGRGRPSKATHYAESDSEISDPPAKQLSAKVPKRAKATGKKGKPGPAENVTNGNTRDENAEQSPSSLSSLDGASEGNAEEDVDDTKRTAKATNGRSTLGKQPPSKRKETTPTRAKPRAKVAADKKEKAVNKEDTLRFLKETQDSEAPKSKRRKSQQSKQEDAAKPVAKPRKKQTATDGEATKDRKTAIASTPSTTPSSTPASRSPEKKTISTRKGMTQPKPTSSTQLSDPFLSMVFGSSQPQATARSKMLSDTDSSDEEDERQKVSKLFDTTRQTPQKRKGKEIDGKDLGNAKKRRKGKQGLKSGDNGGDGDSTTDEMEDESEPEEIEFKRDLDALNGTYVYCKNGRFGLYFGGVVVGFDDLSELSPAKKRKHKDGIYLIRLPVEDDKVFRKRRDEFLTEHDADFATCKLGESVPEVKEDGQISDAHTRLSTPPLPPDFESLEFDNLDYVVQLQAIRGHLERIIREEYLPAQQRIDKFFMKKGKKRTFPQWYGNVSAHYIEEVFLPELTRWAMRPPLKRKGVDMNGATSDPTPPARPTGSARYEALNDDERESYVRKILLNEAIIYMCIKTMDLETLDLETLNALWADDDLYPKETDVDRKTVLMRDLVARKELDQLAHEDPDPYMIWLSLMETRNTKRRERGLPYEGEKEEEKPIQERGGRAARARNNVSYRE